MSVMLLFSILQRFLRLCHIQCVFIFFLKQIRDFLCMFFLEYACQWASISRSSSSFGSFSLLESMPWLNWIMHAFFVFRYIIIIFLWETISDFHRLQHILRESTRFYWLFAFLWWSIGMLIIEDISTWASMIWVIFVFFMEAKNCIFRKSIEDSPLNSWFRGTFEEFMQKYWSYFSYLYYINKQTFTVH